MIDSRIKQAAFTIMKVSGKSYIILPVADMEMRNSRAQNMPCIVKRQLNIWRNICYTSIVQHNRVLDKLFDLVRGVWDGFSFLIHHIKVVQLQHGSKITCRRG